MLLAVVLPNRFCVDIVEHIGCQLQWVECQLTSIELTMLLQNGAIMPARGWYQFYGRGSKGSLAVPKQLNPSGE